MTFKNGRAALAWYGREIEKSDVVCMTASVAKKCLECSVSGGVYDGADSIITKYEIEKVLGGFDTYTQAALCHYICECALYDATYAMCVEMGCDPMVSEDSFRNDMVAAISEFEAVLAGMGYIEPKKDFSEEGD